MRIGHGYDVHRLVTGRALLLGGVHIPYETGLLGHSDADVLLHAVSDALLGAAALGDIGALFPDTDPQYAGADSLQLLSLVAQELQDAGYRIMNIDATVLAQAPKLKPYIPDMRQNIAKACGVTPDDVSVKATTEEVEEKNLSQEYILYREQVRSQSIREISMSILVLRH